MGEPLIQITRKQALLFAGFLVLYEFLTYIANDMIMPGMIKVVESFQGPESAIATSLTAYILGGASLQLFLGPLSDRYGRRPVMLVGALLFFLCTILIACATSIENFLLARFLQGMGLCFIGVIGYATLQEIFSEMDAIRLIALMANVSTLAPLIGPLLGAVFIHYFSWRMIFVVIGVLALVALWGLWRFMPEPIGQVKGDGELILHTPLSFHNVITNYKNLLLNPPFMWGTIALGLIGLPCVIWIALAPVILVKSANLTLIQYGLWQLPVFSAIILGNLFLRRLTQGRNVKQIIIIGSITIGFSLVLTFILTLLTHGNFIGLMPGLICYFFGLGITVAPLNRFVLFLTPIGKGTTSAVISMMVMVFQGLGIEVGNILYASHSNVIFGFYCALLGLLSLLTVVAALYCAKIN